MKIRALSRVPGCESEWQWTEAQSEGPYPGATVQDYIDVAITEATR